MSWYKKAQKIPTMENINWAIDKIIAEQYDFSVEDLQMASQGISSEQGYMQVAAQVATMPKPRTGYPRSSKTTRLPIGKNKTERKIIELFNRGMSTSQISKSLKIPSPKIALLLKKFFGSKTEQQEYLINRNEGDITDTTEELSEEMRGDFSIYEITVKQIGSELNINPIFVQKILTKNNINLKLLQKERKEAIALNISKIVKDFRGVFQIRDIIDEFKKRHNFNLSKTSANAAVKLGNLGIKNKNDPTTIIKAFNVYVSNHIRGGRKELVKNPQRVSNTIDRFFAEYGQKHGFMPPLEQSAMKDMLMTKLQIRDYTMDLTRNAPPVIKDETHPSYFLNNQEEQNELV